jgi:hypothetical protein
MHDEPVRMRASKARTRSITHLPGWRNADRIAGGCCRVDTGDFCQKSILTFSRHT